MRTSSFANHRKRGDATQSRRFAKLEYPSQSRGASGLRDIPPLCLPGFNHAPKYPVIEPATCAGCQTELGCATSSKQTDKFYDHTTGSLEARGYRGSGLRDGSL